MERFLKGLVEKIDKETGTISVAVATDASVDRDGEIVDPGGIDTSNFERNPVLLQPQGIAASSGSTSAYN